MPIIKDSFLEYLKEKAPPNSGQPGSYAILAPLNNKVSCVGAGLAAIENKDIQLSYVQVSEYNEKDYSSPDDRVLIHKLI